ncbi:MAG: AMP-binding protein [Cyanobacteria bacterium SZAS LIN-2]|nr:AMP-binding protein [Cyanobacteria bacterium SZAS LIN-2]
MGIETQFEQDVSKKGSSRTLRDLIDDFDKHTVHPALISFAANTVDTLSYGAMHHSIRQIAAGLAERGLKQGDKVVFFAPNSAAWVMTCLAVLHFGGIAVPMDSQQSNEVLDHIIKDSKAKFICTDAKGVERLTNLYKDNPSSIKVVRLDEADDEQTWRRVKSTPIQPSKLPMMRPDDYCLLFYTSGTTGMPKGVPLTHRNILLQLDSVISKTDLLRPGDRVLLPLPFFHVYPLNIGLLAPFLMGLPIILPRSLTGPEIKRAINEGKVTVIIGVPRLLRSLYQAIEAKFHKNKALGLAFEGLMSACIFLDRRLHLPLGKFIFRPVHDQLGPTLRMFTSGGAPLEATMAAKIKALGFDLACGYGLTETSPLLALRMPDNSDIEGAGVAIEGVEIRIAPIENDDDAGRLDDQGEIQVRGPNVFGGYLNLPQVTKEAFTADGWFRTGDLGYFRGEQLHVVGRASSTIVMEGGEKIQPDDIEDKLSKLAGISEVGLLQKDHKLVALVVPDPAALAGQDARSVIAAHLKEAARGAASYLAVTDFAVTDEPLPRTNLGKIKRFQLKELYDKARGGQPGEMVDKTSARAHASRARAEARAKAQASPPSSAQDQALMEDPAAKKCLDWLKARFPEHDITLDTSPQLDLAIDSLEWINLTFELLEKTGVELTEQAIANVHTVRDLLTEVKAAAAAGGTQSGPANRFSPVEDPQEFLSPAQLSYVQPMPPAQARYARWLYKLSMKLMQPFEVEAIGLENLPEGQFILIPNHASYIDAFAIMAVLPYPRLQKTQWAGWVGIAYGNPLFAYLIKLSQVIPIDAQNSLMTSLAMSAMALKNGKNLVWFPEGERTLDGHLLKFKAGIGMLTEKADIPLVPVYLEGTAEALPPGQFWPTRHKIRVYFDQPSLPQALITEGKRKGEERVHDKPRSVAEEIALALHDRVAALKRVSGRRTSGKD